MNMLKRCQLTYVLVGIFFSANCLAHNTAEHKSDFSGLDTEAAKVVVKFQRALESGDTAGVLLQLTDDVLILEGSIVDRSAQQYSKVHIFSDMNFLLAMEVKTLEHHVKQYETVAFSIARLSSKGTYEGEVIDSISNETLILRKEKDGWKISHVHWSNFDL